MFARRIERFPSLGEMNCANRFATIAVFQILRQQRFNRFGVELLKKSMNDATQHSLRETFGRRIDRRNSAEMNRSLLVVLDYLELRMIHANPFPAQSRLAEDN